MKVWRQAKAITSKAAAEARELTGQERRQLDELLAELDALDTARRSTRDAAIRAAVRPEPNRGTMTPTTFSELLSRNAAVTLPYVEREVRALALGTASAGGNVSPAGFVNELYRALDLTSPVTAAARIFTTESESDLEVPTLTSWGSAASVAEGSALPGTDPTFGQVVLKAHRYAQLVKASNTLLNSQAVSLDPFMAELFARNIDAVTGPLYAHGTGTSQPQGYAHGAGSAIVGGTAVGGAFTADDLFNMYAALDSKYQSGAIWLLSPSAVGTLRKLKDDDLRPLWQPSLSAGDPPTLMGRPVFTDRHLGAVATNGTSVVVMDPSTFAIRFGGGGIRVDRSDDAFFETDEVGFRAVVATDSKYLDTAGAVRFVGGSV